MTATADTVLARAGAARRTRLALALASGAVVTGAVAGQLVASGRTQAVAGLAVLVVPVVLWRRPSLAPALLIFAALTVEQFAATLTSTAALLGRAQPMPSPRAALLTSQIPLFHGLGALHVSPADLLLAGLALMYVARTRLVRSRRWPDSPLAGTMVLLVAAVAVGVGVGLAHHGQWRVAFMEIRPYVYLAATYVLTSVLCSSREAFRAALWALVLGTGVKAAQGLVIFAAVRRQYPRPEAILGHEESLLFALALFLVLALWLYGVRGHLRTVATWLLPLVLLANLANSRRSAWLVLVGGLVTIAVVSARALPTRRVVLTRVLAVFVVLAAVYVPAYWNRDGTLAQPARAMRSAIAPDRRDAADASSDLYRVQENANLRVNIAEGGIVGRGFGVRIDYPLPIVDITDIDPLVAYVPHNGVLYVPMRMGLLGSIAFWCVLGAAIVTACRLARARDRELAVIGAVAVAGVVGYVLLGAVDQAFFLYRIAFVMGALLGLCEAALGALARDGA